MSKTKELYEKAKEAGKVRSGIPFLQLGAKQQGGGIKTTGPHNVKFISDKIIKGQDYKTKVEREEVEFLFEENGEEKIYRVPVYNKEGNLHYLLEKLKEYEYGDEFVLEMKWVGDKNVIDVMGTSEHEEDIPIINEDDPNPENLPETE